MRDRQARNRIKGYGPYAKQLEFHGAGATHRERLLMAANRFGKTECGGAETVFHLTGRYPDWWNGKRFDKPVRVWAAGVTSESTRDVVQAKLFGPPPRREEWGTGLIPHEALGDVSMARGVADLIDTANIKHVSGGQSTLQLKSYERGREKWQGPALEVVWLDEESPEDIYFEALTRTNETGGIVYTTFTPLQGMSRVVARFLQGDPTDAGAANRKVVTATIDDAEHFTPEERERIVASYPEHEKEARTKGRPVMGSGVIFPVDEDTIKVDAFPIPKHWAQLGAMDFGWDHPFAGVHLAWDRDADILYLTKTHRQSKAAPVLHAAALKPWGAKIDGSQWLPWAWPRDGRRETLEGAGIALATQYGEQGLNMLHTHAQFEDGSVSVEAGLMEMLNRMQTGRFKVFAHLNDWFEEFRLYHRKDGKVVKERDDLMSATRYGVMMRRFAEPEPEPSAEASERSFSWSDF